MNAAEFDFGASAPPGDLPVRWIHGSPSPRHRSDPAIQVHAYDPATYILRESKDVSFEAPFLYLFFGNERAILFDTGATADPDRFPLRRTVDALVETWLTAHPRAGYELVVAHTHSHTDHTAGDAQFRDRPACRIVGRSPEEVRRFFGLSDPVDDPRSFDLGGRTLDVFAIPGHHPASIAVYDRWTTLLLTGDTVCPGRLYVFDMPAYLASLQRLARFVGTHPVRWLLGGHVEMRRTAGFDYPFRAKYQPEERPLEMPPERIPSLLSAARSVADRPGVYPFEDCILYHGVRSGTILRMLGRGWLWNLRYRLGIIP